MEVKGVEILQEKKDKKIKRITYSQRKKIEKLRNEGLSYLKIAQTLNLGKTSIVDEVHRNSIDGIYNAKKAQELTNQRKERVGRIATKNLQRWREEQSKNKDKKDGQGFSCQSFCHFGKKSNINFIKHSFSLFARVTSGNPEREGVVSEGGFFCEP